MSIQPKTVCVKERNVFVCVDGVPTALKRHRSCILNGMVHTYDSQKELKQMVLKCVVMQLPKNFIPFNEPVEMLIEFHMYIAKSDSKVKRRRKLGKPHYKRPDLSNLIKFFEDAFDGILYRDDSLIAKIKSSKIYSDEPKTLVCIRPYEPEDFYNEVVIHQGKDE